ncbi:hypothetical protein [Streptomyces chattanoogensis]|uniref:Sortase n=1 Tax=Streptomyces chattanoogensis TaxID=66876 RepID=A0A0N0H259_9ACTN|nr:hypothetical protein [Streptomyces chattanoogensis]KPC65069.1 hypothetical protein ADL29_08430 [Streptomyces chattanoogensis]
MRTHAVPRRRSVRRCAALTAAVAASLALGSGGVATASDDTKAVLVQPDPVPPGGEFSVLDGGNCTGGAGEATFDGTDIPRLKLSTLRGQVGGRATVPRSTKPGEYTVTVTCDGDKGGDRGGDFQLQGDHPPGHGEHGADGPARRTFTGSLRVSAEAEVGTETNSDVGPEGDMAKDLGVPKGGARTGLGGGSGVGTGVTVLGGALLAGAIGWGVAAYVRRPRGGRG